MRKTRGEGIKKTCSRYSRIDEWMDCMNGRTNCRKKLVFDGAGREGAVVGYKGSCKCQTAGKWSWHQTPASYRGDPRATKRAQKSQRDECWAEHNQLRQCVAKPMEQEACLFYLHMQNTMTTETQLTHIWQIYDSIVTTGPTNAHTSLAFRLLCALLHSLMMGQ